MNKKRQLTLIFSHFEQEHFGKDVFLVPYYLGKHLNMSVEIVYPQTKSNRHFESFHRGVSLHPIWCPRKQYFWMLASWYLLWNAHKIDLLMQFHFSRDTLVTGLCYKYLNKKGKLYIKCDGIYWLDMILNKQTPETLRYKAYAKLLKLVDNISIELIEGYSRLLNNKYCGVSLREKSVLMPNGFDEDYLSTLDILERKYVEKEDVIITVGRLGTHQKNTELLLNALGKVDLLNWKVYLIGSVEDSFKEFINAFYANNPEKRKSVIFLGAVYDKKKLWEFYNISKVFVLTSRYEGYPIVFSEAKRFKNFIISTNIEAANDFIESPKVGEIFSVNDSDRLVAILNDIVSGKKDVNAFSKIDASYLSWNQMVKKIKV